MDLKILFKYSLFIIYGTGTFIIMYLRVGCKYCICTVCDVNLYISRVVCVCVHTMYYVCDVNVYMSRVVCVRVHTIHYACDACIYVTCCMRL